MIGLILVLCCVGAYATNNRIFDVQSILIFGIVGYVYHKFSLPTASEAVANVDMMPYYLNAEDSAKNDEQIYNTIKEIADSLDQ